MKGTVWSCIYEVIGKKVENEKCIVQSQSQSTKVQALKWWTILLVVEMSR